MCPAPNGVFCSEAGVCSAATGLYTCNARYATPEPLIVHREVVRVLMQRTVPLRRTGPSVWWGRDMLERNVSLRQQQGQGCV